MQQVQEPLGQTWGREEAMCPYKLDPRGQIPPPSTVPRCSPQESCLPPAALVNYDRSKSSNINKSLIRTIGPLHLHVWGLVLHSLEQAKQGLDQHVVQQER